MTELSRVPGTQTCGAGKTRGPSAGGCRHPLRAAGFPLGGHRPGSLPLSGHQQDTGGEPGHTLCGPALSSPNSSLFPTGSPYRQHGWREPGDWGAAAPATQGACGAGRGGQSVMLGVTSGRPTGQLRGPPRGSVPAPRAGTSELTDWLSAEGVGRTPARLRHSRRPQPGLCQRRAPVCARGPRGPHADTSEQTQRQQRRGPRRGAPGRVAAPAERKSRGYCRRLLPTGTRGHATALTVFHSAVPGLFPPRIKMMDSRAGGRMHTCSQVGPLRENKEWSQEGDQGDLHCDFNALEKICPNVNTRYFWEVGMWSLASRHLNCCLPEKNSTI